MLMFGLFLALAASLTAVKCALLDEILSKGDVALRGRDVEQALIHFHEAERIEGNHLGVIQGLAMAYSALSPPDHAKSTGYWMQAVLFSSKPTPELFYNTALGFYQQGLMREAIQFFERCGNSFRPAILKLASVYRDLEEPEKVLKLLDRAIELDPNSPDAYAYMGDTHNNLKNFGKAIQLYEESLRRAKGKAPPPAVVQTWISIGDSYVNLKRPDMAIGFYQRAQSIGERFKLPISMTANAVIGLHFARVELGSWQDYEAGEERVIDLAVRSVRDPSVNNGIALVSPYRLLFVQRPEVATEVSRSWSAAIVGSELKLTPLSSKDDRHVAPLSSPLPPSCSLGPLGATTTTTTTTTTQTLPPKLRIAYLSRRFLHEYPGTQLMLDIFSSHNRSVACVYSVAFAPDQVGGTSSLEKGGGGGGVVRSEYRSVVANSSDEFIDLSTASVIAAAETILSRQIDVIIDYDGLHDYNSIKLLARRPAQIAFTWLGFAGPVGQGRGLITSSSSGSSSSNSGVSVAVDYMLADRFVLPPDLSPSRLSLQAGGERLIFLPHYQPQSLAADERQPLDLVLSPSPSSGSVSGKSSKVALRLTLLREFLELEESQKDRVDKDKAKDTQGMSSDSTSLDVSDTSTSTSTSIMASGRWILSFNRMSKMTPGLFHGLCNLLRVLPDSYLVLLVESPTATASVRTNALYHGIPPHRLLLFRRLPKAAYKQLLRAGDLFVDTRNYGSHTVASDSMIQGVPVLTLPGLTFSSRVALSINIAAGSLSEAAKLLVVASEKSWEHVALQLLLHTPASQLLGRRVALASRGVQGAGGPCIANSVRTASHIERAAMVSKDLLEGSGRLQLHRERNIWFEDKVGRC